MSVKAAVPENSKNDKLLHIDIRHADITREVCDAIVCSTNESLIPNDGIHNHIATSMGQFLLDQMTAVKNTKAGKVYSIGQSRIFLAKYNHEANDPRYVICSATPVYSESDKERCTFHLQSCYYTSLKLANIYGLRSIAFPPIGYGVNGFSAQVAARIAMESISTFCDNITDIRFVLHDYDMYKVYCEAGTKFANEHSLS